MFATPGNAIAAAAPELAGRAVVPAKSPVPGRPHLWPAVCAVVVAAALLVGIKAYIGPRLPGRLPFYAAHAMSFKVNGNVLQRVAFCTPGELPIYGSSELDMWIDHRADAFFQRRPTGFAVFPVGRGGATCLMILQKLAAVGDAARGKRVVIFLSPAWFLQPAVDAKSVAANLAGAQLSGWIFGHNLSPVLKRDIARRLREYPDRLKDQPLNLSAINLLAKPTAWNRGRFALLSPLGELQNVLLEHLDYGVILWEIIFPQKRFGKISRYDQNAAPATGGRIDWAGLVAKSGVDQTGNRDRPSAKAVAGVHDLDFTSELSASQEFADLTLLVRVIKELHMQACFLSQPFDGAASDLAGVSAAARRTYYDRLGAVLRTAGYPVLDFSEHEEDPMFFSDPGHPSAGAWIFYDRAIDDFQAESKRATAGR